MALFASAAPAAPGDFLFKITSPDPQPGSWFGYSVADVDGDVLVGELLRDLELGVDAQGRAYLFDGETGKHQQTFDIPEPMRGDLFASSLAGGDGRVFVSARGVPSRVYAFDANSGEHLHTIREPSEFHNGFGAAVAYSSGSVLVSSQAYSIPFGLQRIGQAELFDAATGELLRPLPNPEPKVGDAFGSSVAIFGNRAVVGAMDDDLPGDDQPDGDNPGRVWVFDRLTGETVFTLENPNPQKIPPHFFSDLFGYTVAANDDIIVVGAREEDFRDVNGSGAAYVFDSQSGTLLHTLFSPHLEERASFGTSLALSPSGHVLIGASGASVNGMPAEGRVYLFDGITGNLLLDVANPEPDRISGFGFTVAATDQRLFVGVPSGEAVYVFEAIPEPSTLVLTGSLLCTALAMRTLAR